MTFSLDDLFEKAADAFDKSADDHYRQADQAEQLSDLFTDETIREQIDGLVVNGLVLATTLGDRLKSIFLTDEEDDEPAPTPEPEAGDIPVFSEDLRERLRTIIENLNVGVLPDEDQPRRGTDRFPF